MSIRNEYFNFSLVGYTEKSTEHFIFANSEFPDASQKIIEDEKKENIYKKMLGYIEKQKLPKKLVVKKVE